MKPKQKYVLKEFKNFAKTKGGKCLSTRFITIHDPLHWCCQEGHKWYACIRIHEANPSWCRKCSNQNIAGKYHQFSLGDCHKIAKKYKGKCLSSEYQNMKTKMIWECSHGHVFLKSLDHVKNQNIWCNQCIKSKPHKSEKIVRQLFTKIFNKSFPTRKPSWLINDKGNRLELDGYNEELKIAFEFNGFQHYENTDIFGLDLCKVQNHDKIKIKLCKFKKIKLIVIHWKEMHKGMDNLKNFLKQEFIRLKIQPKNDINNIKISEELVYYQDRIKQVNKILKKDKFVMIERNNKYGMNYYQIQCSRGHKTSHRSEYEIINKTKNLCKGCALEHKGYNTYRPNISPGVIFPKTLDPSKRKKVKKDKIPFK